MQLFPLCIILIEMTRHINSLGRCLTYIFANMRNDDPPEKESVHMVKEKHVILIEAKYRNIWYQVG